MKSFTLKIQLGLCLWCHVVPNILAFSINPAASFGTATSSTTRTRTSTTTSARMAIGNDGDNSFSGSASELTSALARIDSESQLTRRSSRRPTGGRPGWTKLTLENEDNNNMDDENDVDQEFVYLLEPPSNPSLILTFLGGAGLGQFPQVAYNELLSRISLRLNAAILTVPYSVSLDHFALSRETGELLRRGLVQCTENSDTYGENLPHFYLGHSLGGKLLAIAFSASGARDVSGVGYIAYNNFGFGDTLTMVKSFAENFNDGNENTGSTSSSTSDGFNNPMGGGGGPVLDQILNMAGQAVDMMGVDFDPNPTVMNQILEKRYDEALQQKTRFFVFDDDDLDSSDGFFGACSGSSGDGSTSAAAVMTKSNLKGSHLTPVYVKLGVEDLEVPEEYREFASDAANGFQSASFGDEDLLNDAVTEICDWIMGKAPSRTSQSGSSMNVLPGKE